MHTPNHVRIKNLSYLLVILFVGIAPLRAQLKTTPQDSLLFEQNNLKITTTKASYQDAVIYDNKIDSLNFSTNNINEPSECKAFFTSYYHPLSLVGPYYSYEYGEATQEACGPMSNSLGVTTLNLNTLQSVTLLDIFTEASLLKALKKDPWLNELAQLNTIPITKIKDFSAFMYFLSETASMQFSTQSFTVLAYNATKNEAKVHWVAQEYMGYDHNRHFQLELILHPKEDLKDTFKKQLNFTLGAYKNGLSK
ncbi:hypothetical protein I2486_15745 [Cellulophaga sp. E16_2]|uniref:hypothetical protein n=1 Tax=Cellulophaga sp. E16_2 TaxID=2789297 RepID=UPI001A91795A|nr:hypothetical protein [Cellulophaga sp. E16_2]MBO0592858.1 hypothetical protein [Cellulophaga sp. E16_2]